VSDMKSEMRETVIVS